MTNTIDDFCGSPFWDTQNSWNTTNPDLSSCFQQTVLVWVPCGFLWLFAPWLIVTFSKSPAQRAPWSGLIIAKLIISAILLLMTIIDMSREVNLYLNEYDALSVEFYSPLIQALTLILATSLMYAEKRSSTSPSGVIFYYWFMMSLSRIIAFRTSIMRATSERANEDQFTFVMQMIYFPFVIAELVLCCFTDITPLGKTFTGEKKQSPELASSYVSRLFMAWFDSLIYTGYQRPLKNTDVWALNSDTKSLTLANKFQRLWQDKLRKARSIQDRAGFSKRLVQVETPRGGAAEKKPSLFLVLFKAFGAEFVTPMLWQLVYSVFIFVGPIMLELLINFVQNDEPAWRGYFYGAVIFCSSFLQCIAHVQMYHESLRITFKMQSMFTSAIFTKALRLSNSARKSTTVGEIMNMMSVDIQCLEKIFVSLQIIWSSPLQIAVALYMLWAQLGPSVLAGVAVLILLFPVNGFLMKRIQKLQMRQMKSKGRRTKLINELLNGIKVLKLYAWEIPFADQINKVRFRELSFVKTSAFYSGAVDFVGQAAPFLVLLATFGTYVLVDSANVLDASRAFVSLSLFNIVRYPITMMPLMYVSVVKAAVSIRRIRDYLLNDELDPNSVEKSNSNNEDNDNAVTLSDASFAWGHADEPTILRDVSLTVPKGHLVAIVGPVGAGKSSLLSAILGEMERLQGTVKIQGSIAYVPQQAWIQNATLQNNVLFGSFYDSDKYRNIIQACDLIRDIEILPAGSDTEIGEKGINLSGGQKQRVSLARAVYNDADLYLLDDPLSAVDSHVGKHIFENVLGPNGLLQSKTRILVTHSVTHLSQVDLIVVLKNNTISEMGSYKELLNKKGAFAEFLLTYRSEVKAEDEVLQEIEVRLKLVSDARTPLNREMSDSLKQQHQSNISLSTHLNQERDGRAFIKSQVQQGIEKQKGKLVTKEAAESGQVTVHVYMYFFRSVGTWLCLATLVIFALAWTSSIGTNIWLEVWSSDPFPVNGTQDTDLRDLRLGVYAGLGFSFAFLILAGTMSLILNCVQACHFLHKQLLNAIIHSPMAYFDTTSVGRIVNRFTEDINKVDVMLPVNGRFAINVLMQLVGSLVVITMETPIFLAALIPIGILYCLIQKYYIKASLQLERMEATTRSPIYNHFSETISGGSTIRAYKKQEEFITESNRRVDEGISNVYVNRVSGRWLKIRLDALGCILVLSAVLFAVGNKANMTSSALALSVTYALSFTHLLTMCVYTVGDMEKSFVAVERIREYTEIRPEASWEVEQTKPPPHWPEQGCIVFNNYKTRYREGLDFVLHGITCTIFKSEKVGVVGRTGAGKSSLTLALLRIIEPAEGSIMIDDIDISTIGLHDLRSNLTIIPQDPVLFSGSLRHNLDPFNTSTDEKVWTALKHCHLYDFVTTLPETLHYEVTEGGENLSVGQRQLVCLGRALLRKTKVLILDEATAAIDLETDEVLQATIRKEFADCTVITIAHRLNTILDNDRLMVLDGGKVKEFDKPSALLLDTNSLFYSMAKEAGIV